MVGVYSSEGCCRWGDSFTTQLQSLSFAAGRHSLLEIPHSFISNTRLCVFTTTYYTQLLPLQVYIFTTTTFKIKFSIVAASLVALAAAHNLPAAEESCSASVTITVTQYAYVASFPSRRVHPLTNRRSAPPQHTPSAPASLAITDPAPYPTGPAGPIGGEQTPLPSAPCSSGVAPPPAGPIGGEQTPLPSVATSGTAAPTGTGSYSAPPSEFTGAASGLKVGSALAGVGAVAALFF